MAEFSPVTARRGSLLYVPESTASYVEAEEARRNAPPSAYEMMKRDTVKKVYDETLRATGNEEMALNRSRLVASRIGVGENIWLGIVAPEAALAGASRLVGAATRAFGRGSEAAAPSLRNALTAEERLALPPPRSGPAIEMPPPRQAPPPARDARSAPDEMARFEGEGGRTADEIAAHRQAVMDRIAAQRAFEQRQMSTLEGEGGVTADAVELARRMAAARAEADAARRQSDVARFEGEGGPTGDMVERARQIVRARMEAQAARREMELARMTDEGGGMAMTRPMETGVPPRSASAPRSVEGDVIPPAPLFTRIGESYYGPLATRPGSAMTTSGPMIEGTLTGQGSSRLPYFLAGLGSLGAGVGLGSGLRWYAERNSQEPRAASSPPPASSPPQAQPAREMEEPGYSGDAGRRLSAALLASEPEPGYTGRGSVALAPPMPPPRPRDLPAARTAPAPPRRSESVDSRAADSILDRIFSGKDYQSNSRPVVENNRVNWGDPDNPADFFRADQAMMRMTRENRAEGGGVQGQKQQKDAALVKALEIIERLMHR